MGFRNVRLTRYIRKKKDYYYRKKKDKSSEHYADHTVQTDTDCMENSTTDIDGVTITEKDMNCSANCDFAYITDAEIVYNTEPIVVKLWILD